MAVVVGDNYYTRCAEGISYNSIKRQDTCLILMVIYGQL